MCSFFFYLLFSLGGENRHDEPAEALAGGLAYQCMHYVRGTPNLLYGMAQLSLFTANIKWLFSTARLGSFGGSASGEVGEVELKVRNIYAPPATARGSKSGLMAERVTSHEVRGCQLGARQNADEMPPYRTNLRILAAHDCTSSWRKPQ